MKNKIITKITSTALLGTMLVYSVPVLALTKEETVYSKINADGNSYNTIVSNHLINEKQEKLIEDLSDLTNIKNVNGDEELKQEGNKLIWSADEKDIYYQGETDKSLPIECKIDYKLDGKEISAKELAGKSGKVEITIKYTNKDKHEAKINGKNQTLYTPFVAVCGTIIKNENNRNIKITNGKVVDDGSKTILMGIALPGLKESLNVSNKEVEIPDSVKITMDATDFEMGNIITYVTPKVIEEDDLKIFDELDEMYSKVNTLQASSKKLEQGAKTLQEGANTYSKKSQEFNIAMKQVSNGVNSANRNYEKLNSGINTLNQSSNTLQNGAKTVSEGTKAVSTNLKTISNKLEELQKGTKQLQAGEKQVSEGIDTIIKSISNMNNSDNTTKQIENIQLLLKTNINTLKQSNTTLETMLSAIPETNTVARDGIKKQIEANASTIKILEESTKANSQAVAQMQNTITSQMKLLTNGLEELKEGMTQVQNGTKQIYDGQGQLKAGADTLAGKTEELSQGTTKLYQGTVELSKGTKTLNAGSSEMKNGLNTLDIGANQLLKANNQLTEGAGTLSTGAKELSQGISKFNKEGIETICNYINGDIKNVTERLEKLQDLANKYTHFTMLNKGDKGNTKFIMIIDEIKKETASNEKNSNNNQYIDTKNKENEDEE